MSNNKKKNSTATTKFDPENILRTKNPSGIFQIQDSRIVISHFLSGRTPDRFTPIPNAVNATIPYDHYYSSKDGKIRKRVKSERRYYKPSTNHFPGKHKGFHLFIPPEYMIQLPTYKQLTKDHLMIVPQLWAWGPELGEKLMSEDDMINKRIQPCVPLGWNTRSWFIESEEFNAYRRDCIKYFGYKSSKDFTDKGGFDKSQFLLNEEGYVDYIHCGARNNNPKVIGKILANRTNAELEVLRDLSSVIEDLEEIKKKVINGQSIKNKNLPTTIAKFNKTYKKNVKHLHYGRDVVNKLND